MKYKLKTIPKLLLCFAFLTLTNCSKDEFENQIKSSKRNNEITFEQFKKETGLYDFSKSIHINPNIQQSSGLSRLANGNYELSDFDINTDIIKKLESVNITSYTFRIYPKEYKEEDAKSIFNLSLYKINNVWETTIIQFKLTPLNYDEIKQGLTEQVEGEAKLLYKGDLTNYGSSTVECVEITIVSSYCEGCTGSSCDANSPEGCQTGVCYVNTSSFIICYNIGDGSGTGGGFSGVGPPGDGVGPIGGSENSGVAIVYSNLASDNENTHPMIANVLEADFDLDGDPNTVDPSTNIKKLNRLTKNKNGQETIFKAKIDDYKEKLSTVFIEEGMMYGDEYEPVPGESTKNSTEWDSYPETHYVAIHMHQNTYYENGVLKDSNPVKSDIDVIAMLSFYNYTNNINVTSVLVSRQGTFALRVNNGNQVNEAINALDPDNNSQTSSPEMDKFVSKYNELVQDKFEAGDEAGALAGFIQLINTYQINGQPLGISLFQAVFDAQGNITNWIKL